MKLYLLSIVDSSSGDNQEGGPRSATSSPELFLRDSPGDFLSISLCSMSSNFLANQLQFCCFVLSRFVFMSIACVDNRLVQKKLQCNRLEMRSGPPTLRLTAPSFNYNRLTRNHFSTPQNIDSNNNSPNYNFNLQNKCMYISFTFQN